MKVLTTTTTQVQKLAVLTALGVYKRKRRTPYLFTRLPRKSNHLFSTNQIKLFL